MKKYFDAHHFEKRLEKIEKLVKDKRVIVYGTGKLFQYAINNYNFSNINIIGISDLRYLQAHSGTNDLGYKVILRQDIVKYDFDVILIATKDYLKIMKYFNDGYSNKMIIPLIEKSFYELFKEII